MKKKIVIMVFFALFTIAFLGCDKTTIPTSTTITSNSTTTTTSNLPSNTTTTTTTTSGTTTTTTTTTSNGTVTTVSTTTSSGTTTTTTVQTTTTTQPFDRNLLVTYFQNKSEETLSETQIEAQIGFYTDLFGVTSEADLYTLLLGMDTVLLSFNSISDLDSLNDWYSGAKALGFSREVVSNMMAKMALSALKNQSENMDTSDIDSEIQSYQEDIVAYNDLLTSYMTQISEYCDLQGENSSLCKSYYELIIEDFNNNREFQDFYYDYVDDTNSFDSDIYYALLNLLDNSYYYSYVNVSEEDALNYQTQYEQELGKLSLEEQAMYLVPLTQYEDMITLRYRDLYQAQIQLSNVMDSTETTSITNYINNFFYKNTQSVYYDISSAQYNIEELMNVLSQYKVQSTILNGLVAYFSTDAGYAKLKLLMITVFDIIDYALPNMDEETYNTLMAIFTGNLKPSFDDLDAQTISSYAKMASGLIDLLTATIDDDDLNNIKSILEDVGTLYIMSQGLENDVAQAMLISYKASVNKYVDAIFTTVTELGDFLGSIDQTKAEAIIHFVTFMRSEKENNYESIIELATIIDALLGDDSLDVEFLMGTVVEVYYDVQYMLMPDTSLVEQSKADFIEYVNNIITLSSEIKDYSIESLSQEQFEKMDTLKVYIEAIVKGFDDGFDQVGDISTEYNHDLFVDLVREITHYSLNEEEVEAYIATMMSAVGTDVEEDAYYTVLVWTNYLQSATYIEDFADFQSWFGRVTELGFSNTTIAKHILGMYKISLTLNTRNVSDYQSEIERLEYSKSIYQEEIDRYTSSNNIIIDDLSAIITTVDEATQEKVLAYWNVLILNEMQYIPVSDAYWNAYSIIGSDFVTITYTYEDYLNNIDDEPEYANDIYQNYLFLLSTLSSDQLDVYNIYYDANNLQRQYRQEITDYSNELYDLGIENIPLRDVLDYVNNYYDTYVQNTLDMERYQNRVDETQERIDEFQQIIDQQQGLIDYLSDPSRQELLTDVVEIMLDEALNLVSVADPDTFDIVMQALMYMTGFGPRPEMNMMMKGSESPTFYLDLFAEYDWSPEAVLGYSQDLSTVLKALFSTISEEDFAKIEELVCDYIENTYAMRGVSLEDAQIEAQQIKMMMDKYYPMLKEVLGIVTTTLDSLTVESLASLMQSIKALSTINSELPTFDQVIAIASIISTLDQSNFDFDRMIELYIEVRLDMETGFNYDNETLLAATSTLKAQFNDFLVLSSEIAGYDPANLTDEQVEQFVVFYKEIEYIARCIENPSEIDSTMTFEYNHEDFIELIQMATDYSMTDEGAESLISMAISVTGLSEEQTFVKVVFYGISLMSIQNTKDISLLQEYISRIISVETRKEEFATYVTNIALLYSQNPDTFAAFYEHYNNILNDIKNIQEEIDGYSESFTTNVNTVWSFISTIEDSNQKELATQAFEKLLNWITLNISYETMLNNMFNMTNEDFYWDGELYDSLVAAKYLEPNEDTYNEILSNIPVDEVELYTNMVDLYGSVAQAQEELDSALHLVSLEEMMGPDDMLFIDYLYSYQLSLYELAFNEASLYQMLESSQSILNDLMIQYRIAYAIENFFTDEQNVINTKATMMTVLDVLNAMIQNMSEDDITLLKEVLSIENFTELNAEDLTLFLNHFGAVLTIAMNQVDANDMETANAVVNKFVFLYLSAFEEDSTTIPVDVSAVITQYFGDCVELVPLFASYLSNMTEERVQIILDQITLLQVLDQEESTENIEIQRAIAMATLISALTDDPSITPSDVINTVFGLYFDIQIALGGSNEVTTAERLVQMNTSYTAFIGLVNEIKEYDSSAVLTEEQMSKIAEMKSVLNQIPLLIDSPEVK